jgi:predicted TPR repeat methyltransferase
LLAGEGRATPPEQAPPAYVRGLFDGYAENFDSHLLNKLHYQGPELLYESLQEILDDKSALLDVLDIGCGTGLAGTVFRQLAKGLDGLDISSAMLDKAAQRGIYDRLEQGEIVHRLTHLGQRYDLVVASDVLSYFGDLWPVLHAMYSVLKADAYSVFSVEKGETDGYRLRSTGRYQHHPAYVIAMAQRLGLETLLSREGILREQEGQPVKAVIFVLQRLGN